MDAPTLDTLEGRIGGTTSYHYDVANDVLYLRRVDSMERTAVGEETDDGLIELRDEETDALVGLTIVSWWKRFGTSPALPDSLREIEAAITPLAGRVAA